MYDPVLWKTRLYQWHCINEIIPCVEDTYTDTHTDRYTLAYTYLEMGCFKHHGFLSLIFLVLAWPDLKGMSDALCLVS